MIKCEKYKAKIPETTCVTRQQYLTSERPNKFKALYDGCRGCEVGLRLLKEFKMSPYKKMCPTCKKTYPPTEEFFDKANRAKDGLTTDCKACRAKERGEEFTPPVIPIKTQAPKNRKSKPGQTRKILNINIEDSPGLYDALVERANENLRTPLAQALWILREELI